MTLLPNPALDNVPAQNFRPQKYALFRAHQILPPTLSKLVKLNGKFLFIGFQRAMNRSQERVTPDLIENEKRKISFLVNEQAPFSRVIEQMGFVGGLLAIYLDPSCGSSPCVQKGFPYYLNHKLTKFLFVFDGYQALEKIHGGSMDFLKGYKKFRSQQALILEEKYNSMGKNPYFIFDEQSAVFGVSSIYFSNLAATSAHFWYEAWAEANGDTKRTPYYQIQSQPILKGREKRGVK